MWEREDANGAGDEVFLCSVNPDGAYDGQQRSLEDLQFDLENVPTMSQLVGSQLRSATRPQ